MALSLPAGANGPIIRVGTKGAVFRCSVEVDENLYCHCCSHLLVDGYIAECLVGIRMHCPGCGALCATPGLDPGEILPIGTIHMGEEGTFDFAEPLPYLPSHTITIDQEIRKEAEFNAPREVAEHLSLTREGIIQIVKRFEELTGESSDKKFDSVLRSIASRHDPSTKLPFHWAIRHLLDCIDAGRVNLDKHEDNIALGRIWLFHQIDQKWKHHPRYKTIAREFSSDSSFFNTIGMFVTADYTYKQGKRLGFSILDVQNQPKPDLYTRVGADSKFYYEIKGPKSLVWHRTWRFDRKAIEKNLKSIVSKGDQIKKSHPGVLVFIIAHYDPYLFEFAKTALAKILKNKGRDRRHLLAVMPVLCGSVHKNFQSGVERVTAQARFDWIDNPHTKFKRSG